MNEMDKLQRLANRSYVEISVELGAMLQGFNNFEGAVGLTEDEAKLFWQPSKELLANRDSLGLAREEILQVWERISKTAALCREKAEEFFQDKHDELFQIICVEFCLCNKLESYGSEIDLMVAIAGSLELVFGSFPVLEIAAYIVKQGAKEFCEC